MINCINEILDLIIKTSIVFGIFCLIYFYWRIMILDKKIEKINKNFEAERSNRRNEGRGIPLEIINGQINELLRIKDESISPLERERNRFLSKIPFIK